MAPLPPLDILGSFQDPLNLDQGAGKLVNVRVVPREATEGKPARVRFVGAPGLTQVCKPVASSCIALGHAFGAVWSAHANGQIYRSVETGVPVLMGTVAVDPVQPVIRLAEDRTALVITSNRNVLNPALAGTAYVGTLAPPAVTNCGFDASIQFDPSSCIELDNFAIYGAASNVYANQSDRMYRSDPLAPATVQPNSWATKEARADRIVDLALSGRYMWVLGSRAELEQWYNSGADPADIDFPFQAFPNSLVEVGLASRTTLATLRGNVVFVGTDRRLWRCSGQSAQPISPQWIDLLLQQLTVTQLGQLTAYAYGQGGADFYVLTLPGAWSLELSSSTGVWSYRQTFNRLDHAGRCATEHDNGVTYVGLDTGEICTLDISTANEPAGRMSRVMITPWVGAETTRQTYDSLEITSSMGPSAGTFQLDWSLDRAQTWRGARQILMPEPGERQAIARGMGTTRRRQFRLQYSGAQAPFTVDEWLASVTPGN